MFMSEKYEIMFTCDIDIFLINIFIVLLKTSIQEPRIDLSFHHDTLPLPPPPPPPLPDLFLLVCFNRPDALWRPHLFL